MMKAGKTGVGGVVFAIAVAVASPAAGQGSPGGGSQGDGCDPAVRQALSDEAAAGVERDLVVIRHQDEGIGDPDSLFDLQCEIFNFPQFDALVSLPTLQDLLDALKRRACAAAREAWQRNVGRQFNRTVYDVEGDIERLPGLEAIPASGRDRARSPDLFESAIGGGSQ